MLEFRGDLVFASRYFRDSFPIAKNSKLKTREIKYPPNLVPSSLSLLLVPMKQAEREREPKGQGSMEDKILRTINTICLNFSSFPPLP